MGGFTVRFAICRCGHGKPQHGTSGACLIATCDCERFTKGQKFGAQRVTRDGLTFDSRREARRYERLVTEQALGRIAELEVHPVFPLWVARDVDSAQPRIVTLGRRYEADFRYRETMTGAVVIEDAKGMRTPLYKLKKRIAEVNYGIQVVEV